MNVQTALDYRKDLRPQSGCRQSVLLLGLSAVVPRHKLRFKNLEIYLKAQDLPVVVAPSVLI